MALLDLDEEQLCTVLGVDALTVLSGEAEYLPQLGVLLGLLDGAAETVGAATLARWVRRFTPSGQPLTLLESGDYAAFEAALEDLLRRGLVIRARDGA